MNAIFIPLEDLLKIESTCRKYPNFLDWVIAFKKKYGKLMEINSFFKDIRAAVNYYKPTFESLLEYGQRSDIEVLERITNLESEFNKIADYMSLAKEIDEVKK